MKLFLLLIAISVLPLDAQVFLRSGVPLTNSTGLLRPRITPQIPSIVLASHGDSISRDLERSNYLFVVWTNIVSGVGIAPRFAQRGINGISFDYRWPSEPYTATMIEDALLAVDNVQYSGATNWLVVFAGTNGIALGLHSAATEYANFKTYIAARIAAGWSADRIVAVTCLPRNGINNTIRDAFNASMAGDDGGYGYRLARVDLNTDIGENGDNLDTTYYYDGIHPTEAGHAIIASVIFASMYP